MVLVTCMVLYNITNGQVIDIIFFSLICKDTETMSTRLKHTEAIKETKAWSGVLKEIKIKVIDIC